MNLPNSEATHSTPDQPVELRAHHLLCALTYSGKGYGTSFTRTFDDLIARLTQRQLIKLTARPDALCRSGQNCNQCELHKSACRDHKAMLQIATLLTLDELPSLLQLDSKTIDTLRAAFACGEIRAACHGCTWRDYCTAVSDGGYLRARLHPIENAP